MTTQSRTIYNRDAFAASTPLETLKAGRGVHKLTIGLQGDMVAAAAITPAVMAAIIQPFEVRLMGSPVIQMRGDDLWAFNVLHLKKNPLTITAGANINDASKIMGLEIPLRQPARSVGDLSMRVTRVGNAGIDTELLTVTEQSSDVVDPEGFYHAVEMPMVLRAAVGYGNFLDLPQPGDLHGILFWNTTIPITTTLTSSVAAVAVEINKERAYVRTFDEMHADAAYNPTFASPAATTLLDDYSYIDFSHEPIPKDAEVRLDINAGVANDPVRVIPIYRCKA
jgi:hypothetical protein